MAAHDRVKALFHQTIRISALSYSKYLGTVRKSDNNSSIAFKADLSVRESQAKALYELTRQKLIAD